MSAESTLANAVPNVATASFPDLAGKSVLISGGASGIGAELVRAFAGQSCDVTFVDIDMTAGQELAEALSRDGRARVTFVACDVTDGPAYRAAIDGAAAYSGRFDILVNNAANDVRRPTVTLGDDEVDWLMAINFKHQLVAAQAAFRHMAKAGRGSIINFSSVAPTMRIPDLAVYGSAKAAVHGLTRMLAREFGRSGVRVNTIVPGYVFTPNRWRCGSRQMSWRA